MAPRQESSVADRPLVAVVDDDESIRESLPDLLREFGFAARAFSSAEAYLQSDAVHQSKCLVLDIAMPGMNGLDLQRELARRGLAIPIIFITGHKDEELRAQALAQGAAGFLHKPFGDMALLEALRKAVPSD